MRSKCVQSPSFQNVRLFPMKRTRVGAGCAPAPPTTRAESAIGMAIRSLRTAVRLSGIHRSLASRPVEDLISQAEGVHKPDPEIFRRALARLQAEPARSVFAGDHPEVDIGSARAAGMWAVWRRDPAVSRQVNADATIEEVADLLALLGGTNHQI